LTACTSRASTGTASFERPLLNGSAIGERTRGEFTENNLGMHMLRKAQARPDVEEGAHASAGVLEGSEEFGGWLYDDSGTSMIIHLDRRKFLSAAERDARGIPAAESSDFSLRRCTWSWAWRCLRSDRYRAFWLDRLSCRFPRLHFSYVTTVRVRTDNYLHDNHDKRSTIIGSEVHLIVRFARAHAYGM